MPGNGTLGQEQSEKLNNNKKWCHRSRKQTLSTFYVQCIQPAWNLVRCNQRWYQQTEINWKKIYDATNAAGVVGGGNKSWNARNLFGFEKKSFGLVLSRCEDWAKIGQWYRRRKRAVVTRAKQMRWRNGTTLLVAITHKLWYLFWIRHQFLWTEINANR